MNYILKIGLFTFAGAFLLACDNDDVLDETHLVESDFSEDQGDEEYYDQYAEFCLQGSKLDVDPSTITDDDCIFRIEGRNRADLSAPKTNAVFAGVSDFGALRKAGIDSFEINIKIGPQAPKIETGVYTVVPYSVLGAEIKPLPSVMAHLHAIKADSDSVFNAVMRPDVEKLKKSAVLGPSDYPDYEIVSATLKVTHVEDIPLPEDAKESQEIPDEMRMLTGQQYVKGTFTFSIKKLGPNGSNFGPETFTFGSINDWRYLPQNDE